VLSTLSSFYELYAFHPPHPGYPSSLPSGLTTFTRSFPHLSRSNSCFSPLLFPPPPTRFFSVAPSSSHLLSNALPILFLLFLLSYLLFSSQHFLHSLHFPPLMPATLCHSFASRPVLLFAFHTIGIYFRHSLPHFLDYIFSFFCLELLYFFFHIFLVPLCLSTFCFVLFQFFQLSADLFHFSAPYPCPHTRPTPSFLTSCPPLVSLTCSLYLFPLLSILSTSSSHITHPFHFFSPASSFP